MNVATFRACANIAFIKYWGVKDRTLNLPYTNSMSMTLSHAHTTTSVAWLSASVPRDEVLLNGRVASGSVRARVVAHLDRLRDHLGHARAAKMASVNNFPAAAGIASSASGFCALTLAGNAACAKDGSAGNGDALARLARRASGSACRSFFGGFVEWEAGADDRSSLPRQLHAPDHWDLRDIVVIVSAADKKVSSHRGHAMAARSFLLQERLRFVDQVLTPVRAAIRDRDLKTLGPLMEKDALFMHAVMLTSRPPLLYLNETAIHLMAEVQSWRDTEGLEAYFTIDAGPNLHLICEAKTESRLVSKLQATGLASQIMVNRPGPGPVQLSEHLV